MQKFHITLLALVFTAMGCALGGPTFQQKQVAALERIEQQKQQQQQAELDRLADLEIAKQAYFDYSNRRIDKETAANRVRLKQIEASNFTDEDKALMRDRRLRIGFTSEQVILSMGAPSRERRSTTAAGTYAFWDYGRYASVMFRGNSVVQFNRR